MLGKKSTQMPKQPLLTPNLKYHIIIKDSEVVGAQHLSHFPSSLFFHHVAQTLRHLEGMPELLSGLLNPNYTPDVINICYPVCL